MMRYGDLGTMSSVSKRWEKLTSGRRRAARERMEEELDAWLTNKIETAYRGGRGVMDPDMVWSHRDTNAVRVLDHLANAFSGEDDWAPSKEALLHVIKDIQGRDLLEEVIIPVLGRVSLAVRDGRLYEGYEKLIAFLSDMGWDPTIERVTRDILSSDVLDTMYRWEVDQYYMLVGVLPLGATTYLILTAIHDASAMIELGPITDEDVDEWLPTLIPRDASTGMLARITNTVRRDHKNIWEEEHKVEPKNYWPVVPLWALNGVKGIGTGFSTELPPYSPLKVVEWILLWLTRQETPELKPWYRGYEGVVRKEKGRWISEGAFEQNPVTNAITVTELPITLTCSAYNKKCSKLKADGKIGDWKDVTVVDGDASSMPVLVKFLLYKPRVRSLSALGLRSTIGDKNIYLFSPEWHCEKYNGAQDALACFCKARLQQYARRKALTLPMLRERLAMNEAKVRYIEDVISGSLVISRRKKEDVLADMKSKGYPPSFLKMSMASLTQEKIASLTAAMDGVKEEISYYERSSPRQLWAKELQELAVALRKL